MNESDLTPEERFSASMLHMLMGVKDLGIDPDSALRCSEHKEFMFDPDHNFKPTWHYQHGEEIVNKDQMALDPGTDLCSTLRRTWGQYEDSARVIAQAIELGLGFDKAKQVLRALENRIDSM